MMIAYRQFYEIFASVLRIITHPYHNVKKPVVRGTGVYLREYGHKCNMDGM